MTGAPSYSVDRDLVAQVAEAREAVQSLLGVVPMSAVFACSLAAWVEVGGRDRAAAGDLAALEAVMVVLVKVAAERSGFAALPRRGNAARTVDLLVSDRGGTVPVMIALGAVAGLALAVHGEAGRAAIRRVGDVRHELFRRIGETIGTRRA